MRRALGILAVAVLAASGAGGCKSFKYFQINVKLDNTNSNASMRFDTTSAGQIEICLVEVTGTDHDRFNIGTGPNGVVHCPPPRTAADPFDLGTFEYHSLADSGTDTFTVTVYNNTVLRSDCVVGTGSKAVPVSDAMTLAGDVLVERTGAGCPNGPGPMQLDANLDYTPVTD